jgi:DNA-binding HxlR family transcriptional regulator
MMWKTDDMKACPIDVGFEILGKKFAALIIRNMISLQSTKFNQFLESIDGIRPKILSNRLKESEKSGLIERKIYHERPIRIEYCLTEKGKAVKPILDQMAIFSMRYCPSYVFTDGLPRNKITLRNIIKINTS